MVVKLAFKQENGENNLPFHMQSVIATQISED